MSKSIKATTGDLGRQISDFLEEKFLAHFEGLMKCYQRGILLELLKLHFKYSKTLEKDIEKLCREAIIEKIVK